MSQRALLVALGLAVSACSSGDDACPARVTLTFQDASQSRRGQVCAEVADTEAARVAGLTGRGALAADEGLLLEFPAEDELCITNEKVGFDIDVYWIDNVGTIRAVERLNAGAALTCRKPARYVLETAASALPGIAPGGKATIEFLQ